MPAKRAQAPMDLGDILLYIAGTSRNSLIVGKKTEHASADLFLPSFDQPCARLVAIFVPPLPIIAKHGCSAQIPLNILLCILGWIPGVIHAWVVISRNPARPELYPPAY
ncbi:hypothetical protein FFLO_06058 [Filobasidium floriforme]|uniref:Plasma membrane proteolipid 3 n=1 Tax=Filobasidium floriforme TaxID=5210 RepID=A0A8K0JLA0_9TREE|nr:uncharacterized protein HD553DRAFT_315684 [Filobasidium floriforme]KAG7528604.1 hypothetical protein FFLO_06058 [Filobasidium floriforme]KAH8081520.1 hypothetical protein HD553DRAFT_315684 [Filobasidium floriforme]